MTDQAALASKVETGVSQLRCIGCGAVGEEGAKSVRCARCGDLLEVAFPGWKTNAGTRVAGLDAAGLKKLWLQRRTSWNALDESGVWRFREILPALHDWNHVITLREGNTSVSMGAYAACRNAQPCPDSARPDHLGKTFASSRLWRCDLPVED